ncbi:flavodoxin family protein [Cytobacillus purgationiresistens]|uniref:Multimeric flavodoxin WrbA n=1 Tax=Cytobacillus purgationiresistens TaxID=863449 RepID=A0ABU0AMZ0_9BACI|nr:NAD(P)H-dependent oxidoreductase [Cytobacillus purgationiresistens]MDQ0272239.1 multimeric flavodoxin WrbA [Cytobacillus purgationiresistens]
MELKALVINCTLKKSSETSNTLALAKEVTKHFDNVDVEYITAADYSIGFGITHEAVDEQDQWPMLFEKVKAADIVLIASPIWLGEQSSIANLVIERLNGGSSLTNEKGQSIYYNKVGGAVVTGNEDGAKNVGSYLLYSLHRLGFTIPPNVDAYWVGEAGPGFSFIEANGEENEFTMEHAKMTAYNLMYFAKLLKSNPIPAERK